MLEKQLDFVSKRIYSFEMDRIPQKCSLGCHILRISAHADTFGNFAARLQKFEGIRCLPASAVGG